MYSRFLVVGCCVVTASSTTGNQPAGQPASGLHGSTYPADSATNITTPQPPAMPGALSCRRSVAATSARGSASCCAAGSPAVQSWRGMAHQSTGSTTGNGTGPAGIRSHVERSRGANYPQPGPPLGSTFSVLGGAPAAGRPSRGQHQHLEPITTH